MPYVKRNVTAEETAAITIGLNTSVQLACTLNLSSKSLTAFTNPPSRPVPSGPNKAKSMRSIFFLISGQDGQLT
ncbi:MAG: hypothetical protein ACQCN6_01775 [Candidatus Bathyarchaeia archaeon]